MIQKSLFQEDATLSPFHHLHGHGHGTLTSTASRWLGVNKGVDEESSQPFCLYGADSERNGALGGNGLGNLQHGKLHTCYRGISVTERP
jgi:hypothetical protein